MTTIKRVDHVEPVSIQWLVPRTGQGPLAFSGRLLAQALGERQLGIEQTRYHEIAIYETDGGKFVVQITYRSKWEGETDHYVADFFTDPADVVAELTRYDPAKYVQGYPLGQNFADKQARLLRDIKARYQALVSAVLTNASADFTEVID